MAEQNSLQSIIEKIKGSDNTLVAVNSNPSVDELSAALAVTLAINDTGKHATAVFSGEIPPAISFLDPEKTFENTVNSLRDFIIALDKEKADHIRYKVVDDLVKIFVTPYRTTIDENDLEFSQGDFNVELVLAIGVNSVEDLDHALESHGKILHDAPVIAVSLDGSTDLGGIEWTNSSASSYSEILTALVEGLRKGKQIDNQVATALLTGIVSATDRFRNDRTTPDTMSVAAKLMAAGADQKLVAENVEIGSSKDTFIDKNGQDAGESTKEEVVSPDNNQFSDSSEAEQSDDTSREDSAEADKDDGVGALSISHLPKGDIDAVAREVADIKSERALDHAEKLLGKHDTEDSSETSDDVVEGSEDEFARELAEVSPMATVGGVSGNDLASAGQDEPSPDVNPVQADFKPPEETLPEVQNVPELKTETRSDNQVTEPSLGGTLNATTEEAEEAKRRELEDERNRTILSHGSPATVNTPATNPISSPFDSSNASATVEAAMATDPYVMQHSAPVVPLSQPASLPPMPDFSTLPPPVDGSVDSSPVDNQLSAGSVTNTVEDMLLNSSNSEANPITPADPTQFRIPGQ